MMQHFYQNTIWLVSKETIILDSLTGQRRDPVTEVPPPKGITTTLCCIASSTIFTTSS